MKKAVILFLYGTALFFVMKNYYKDPQHKGLPQPQVLAAPTYLYGILALVADFSGGFAIPLAGGFTLWLIWNTQNTKQVSANKSTPLPNTKVSGGKI